MRLKATTKARLRTLRNKYREFSTDEIIDFLKDLTTGPYELENLLGKGGFGQVFKISKVNPGTSVKGENFAFKVVDYKNGAKMDSETKELAIEEIKFLEELKGKEFVTQLIEWNDNTSNEIITMVLELMDSDLKRCLKSLTCYDNKIKDNKLKVVKTLLEGLNLIHQKGIAHLDIKPENIMIKNDEFKYGDFGLALKVKKGKILNLIRGTPLYLDLNAYEGVNPTNPGLGLKSDLYSLGLTILEVIDRNLFLCLNREDIYCNEKGLKLKNKIRKILSNNIGKMSDYKIYESFCTLKEINIRDSEDDFLTCLVVRYIMVPYNKRIEISELIKNIEIYENRDQIIREEEENRIREEEEQRRKEEEIRRIREEEQRRKEEEIRRIREEKQRRKELEEKEKQRKKEERERRIKENRQRIKDQEERRIKEQQEKLRIKHKTANKKQTEITKRNMTRPKRIKMLTDVIKPYVNQDQINKGTANIRNMTKPKYVHRGKANAPTKINGTMTTNLQEIVKNAKSKIGMNKGMNKPETKRGFLKQPNMLQDVIKNANTNQSKKYNNLYTKEHQKGTFTGGKGTIQTRAQPKKQIPFLGKPDANMPKNKFPKINK